MCCTAFTGKRRCRSDPSTLCQDVARRDRATPEAVRGLLAQATALGFDSLPEVVANDKQLCADQATDHLTVTVTLFRPAGTKRVEDYLGCRATSEDSTSVIVRLRSFENAIDSTAGASRWVRPTDRR